MFRHLLGLAVAVVCLSAAQAGAETPAEGAERCGRFLEAAFARKYERAMNVLAEGVDASHDPPGAYARNLAQTKAMFDAVIEAEGPLRVRRWLQDALYPGTSTPVRIEQLSFQSGRSSYVGCVRYGTRTDQSVITQYLIGPDKEAIVRDLGELAVGASLYRQAARPAAAPAAAETPADAAERCGRFLEAAYAEDYERAVTIMEEGDPSPGLPGAHARAVAMVRGLVHGVRAENNSLIARRWLQDAPFPGTPSLVRIEGWTFKDGGWTYAGCIRYADRDDRAIITQYAFGQDKEAMIRDLGGLAAGGKLGRQ